MLPAAKVLIYKSKTPVLIIVADACPPNQSARYQSSAAAAANATKQGSVFVWLTIQHWIGHRLTATNVRLTSK